jgi:hypothetical protein
MFGIISAISSAISVVSNAVSTVGKALVTGATKLLEIAGEKLEEIVNIIETVGKILDVISQNENVDELGAKAMQSEKKPEDFDKVSEYIEYLKNDVELDIDKFNNAKTEDKFARKAIGATVISKGIEEKKGILIPLGFWKEVAKQEMGSIEIDKTIDLFKDNKMDNKFSEYMNGKLEYSDEIKVGKMVVDMYRELEPNMTIEEIEGKVMKMEAKKDTTDIRTI